MCPNVTVYICRNCIPEGGRLPRQWRQDGLHVQVRQIPCSGKVDGQYLFHALEGGVDGLCVVACPRGKCRLFQGNYRAEARIQTVKRLLSEIGLDPGRVELLRSCPSDPAGDLERAVRASVQRFRELGRSPMGTGS